MNNNLYRRELVGWAVNRVGSALGWSLFAAFAVALIGALTESLVVVSLAGLVGAATFALILSNSRPPWPSEVIDESPSEPESKHTEDSPRRGSGVYRRSAGHA